MNKRFKRAACLFLVIVLGLSVAACGKNEYSDYDSASQQKEQPSNEGQTVDAPAMTVEEFFGKAAFIGDSVTLKLR